MTAGESRIGAGGKHPRRRAAAPQLLGPGPCDCKLLTQLQFQCVDLVLQVEPPTVLLLCALQQAPHIDQAAIVGHQAFVLHWSGTWLCTFLSRR